MTVKSQEVFYCKNDCEENFQPVEKPVVFGPDGGNAFQADRGYTQNNEPEQENIELPATGCVGPENDNE